MVEEPTTTKLLESPVIVRTALLLVTDDAGTKVDVAILEVTVEPSELVVVTSIDVGSSVELGACEDTSEDMAEDPADVWLTTDDADETGESDGEDVAVGESVLEGVVVVSPGDVVVGLTIDEVEDMISVGDEVVVGVLLEMSDVELDSDVICEVEEVEIGVVDEVTPVPTTCLFGMMPCGGSCALTCVATPSRPRVRKASILMVGLLQRAETYGRANSRIIDCSRLLDRVEQRRRLRLGVQLICARVGRYRGRSVEVSMYLHRMEWAGNESGSKY
jgi:hypothetical protein